MAVSASWLLHPLGLGLYKTLQGLGVTFVEFRFWGLGGVRLRLRTVETVEFRVRGQVGGLGCEKQLEGVA